ncbi:MAG: acyl transferase [Bacteroidota bacterium]
MNQDLSEKLWKFIEGGGSSFAEMEADIREYQMVQNPVLKQYSSQLPGKERLFLPISFFKHFQIKTGIDWQEEHIFESSRTTGQTPSRHFVKSLDWYEKVCLQGFHHFFPQQEYAIFALLPGYLERTNASLVHMVNGWMKGFGLPESGFFLDNMEELAAHLKEAYQEEKPVILIGVTFALLDFAERYPTHIPDAIIIETGGMKGRREELTRSQVHMRLKDVFGVDHVVSEYGMTELMSQAYALENGRFQTPPWMKIYISDIHLSSLPKPAGKTGRINIIDLGNIHSCSFIATDDIGRMYEDGSFEVLGRLDNAELRGCNLMYE